MSGLRFPVCLALVVVAGCGSGDLVATGVSAAALNSCNDAADCPLPMPHGTCVKTVCNNHACEYAMDATACPSGCTVGTQAADCNLGATNCFIVQCTAGVCDFSDYSASSGCQCKMAGDCAAANGCQNAPTCNSATCTYTAKQPLTGTSCCNVAGDCGGTATCAANTCSCTTGEKFCRGASAGMGACIPSTACCVDADCPAKANATATCSAAHACVYTCNGGFHDCSGTCKSDTSVASCGTSCTPCPMANNACQVETCTAGVCGIASSGASPCCSSTSDCTPANACQTATACTANQCVFGSTGASGCCNSASDCAAPSDPCLTATCVANQCATAPIGGCTVDMATPPADLAATASPDLSTPLSVGGGGGCALAPGAASPGGGAFALVALVLLALSLRRRA